MLGGALGGLGDAYYLRGDFRSASEQFRACVRLSRDHGYRRAEVANRHMVGWARLHLMEFNEALVNAIEGAALSAEVSHRRAESLSLALGGEVGL